jgi:hypothetical protein
MHTSVVCVLLDDGAAVTGPHLDRLLLLLLPFLCFLFVYECINHSVEDILILDILIVIIIVTAVQCSSTGKQIGSTAGKHGVEFRECKTVKDCTRPYKTVHCMTLDSKQYRMFVSTQVLPLHFSKVGCLQFGLLTWTESGRTAQGKHKAHCL